MVDIWLQIVTQYLEKPEWVWVREFKKEIKIV